MDHRESTRLQYGLTSRAVALGWPEQRVLVIDEDLGKSGSSAEGREGFARLVAEVGLDHVRLIVGVESHHQALQGRPRRAMVGSGGGKDACRLRSRGVGAPGGGNY
jgi:hypothetical protein